MAFFDRVCAARDTVRVWLLGTIFIWRVRKAKVQIHTDLGSCPHCATELHGTSGKSFFICLRPASGQKVNTLSCSGALGDQTGSGFQSPLGSPGT